MCQPWELCQMYNVHTLNLGHKTLRELGVLSGQGQRFPCIVLIGDLQPKIETQRSQRKETNKSQ